MDPEIAISVTNGIAQLEFNRPDQGNAFTTEQVTALSDALDRVSADSEARILVLTGRGRHFNIGGVAANGSSVTAHWERSPDAHRAQVELAVHVIRRIHRMPMPTIAAINGGCAGAGLAIALAADLRFAARHARFNTAFADNSLPGELGAIWFADRILGAARTAELFLLPDKLDADTAQEIGLVNAVFEPDELLPQVYARARRLASVDPGALRAMKANLLDARSAPLDDYLDRETHRLIANAWTSVNPSRRRLEPRPLPA